MPQKTQTMHACIKEYEENALIEQLEHLAGKGYTVDESSNLLGVELETVKELVEKGKVKFAKCSHLCMRENRNTGELFSEKPNLISDEHR